MAKTPKYQIIDFRDALPVNTFRINAGGKIPKRSVKGIQRIVIHCTDDDDKQGSDIYGLAKYDIGPNHISKHGCYTMTYTYYIESVNNSLKIYHAVDDEVITWHVGYWNEDSLAIGVDKLANDKAPDKWTAAVWLSAYLCKRLYLKPKQVVFHRELERTGWYWREGKKVLRKTCPGMVWDPVKFREDVTLELLSLNSESTMARIINKFFKPRRMGGSK